MRPGPKPFAPCDEVISPAVLESMLLSGLLNCGWLKTLYESARTSRFMPSRMRKVFPMLRSALNCLGPRRMFLPESPNAGVVPPFVGSVNAVGSNHLANVGLDTLPLPMRLGYSE